MTMYRSEESALARVELLKRETGIWPAVIYEGRGRWRLSYEPPVAVTQLDSHGYEMGGRG